MPLFFVHFDKGSSKLRPESYPQLDELARFLQAHPNVRLELAGHTDGTSRAETELQLSRNRALAVRDYLVRKGIARERFNIVGYGKARPIADNETPEGQQKNRRVEFRILGL
jgi:outer membrane protein OmpA-like peptidoglycan-associated protein